MYRIYTEDINRAGIEAILNSRFDAYTLLPAVGVWRGQREQSLVVEVETQDRGAVEDAARAIKEANRQEAVLLLEVPAEAVLV
jgi:hypothetical protein